ncbi:MAG: hypothetical protein KDH15_10105 [Rhodocyclaceae bacterium]|nr:hypothetical protein [Rhodocyclaceae bacterium]
MSIRPLFLWLAVDAALVAALAAMVPTVSREWRAPEPIAPDSAAFDVPRAAEEVSNPELLQETLARPLFFASRRPPSEPDSEPTPEVAAEDDPLGELQLLGLFSAGDRLGGLIVREDGASRRIAIGDRVGGWKLETLTGLEARFSRAGEVARLQLEHSQQARAAAAGADEAADGGQIPVVQGSAASGGIIDQIRDRRARRIDAIREARERLKGRRAPSGGRASARD